VAEGTAEVTAGITRRQALGLLPAVPAALRALAQTTTRPAVTRRIFSQWVIEPDGRVKAWTTSPNMKGAALGLGDDRIVPRYVAQEIPTLKGCTMIAVGSAKYALMADGTILAWESSWSGLLGNTPLSEFEATGVPHPDGPTPVRTVPMPTVTGVAAGQVHVLVVTADGEVFTWGNGQAGQLGIGSMPTIHFTSGVRDTTYYLPFPSRVPMLSQVIAVAAGSKHSLAVTKDGTVYSWGENRYGQLGDGTTTNRLTPVLVRGVTSAVAVAAAYDFSVALLADGTVMTWGHGSGALGRPGITGGGPNPIPALVPYAAGVTAISAGGQHVLALTRTGLVLAWGEQNAGQVGRATSPTVAGPVPAIADVRFIHATGLTSFAVLADGTIMVWGMLPSISYRVDGADGEAAHFPVPLLIKGL
jgi:alpha-tubulin suppressor-like RCC1 family protein